MNNSIEQESVLSTWQQQNNTLINAGPGTGKTSTIFLCAKKNRNRKNLIIAFNNSIVTEINEKITKYDIGRYNSAKTLHSLGLDFIKKSSDKKFKIDSYLSYKIFKRVENENPELFQGLKWKKKLLIQESIDNFNSTSKKYLTENLDVIKSKLISMGKTYSDYHLLDDIWDKFFNIREQNYKDSFLILDFDDLLYLPHKWDLDVPYKTQTVMIDEAQDLNFAQHSLFNRFLVGSEIEQYLVVGDPKQSIYGFTGALSNSFDTFKKEDVKEEYLTLCFRCAKNIVKCANEIYPDSLASFRDEEGIVEEIFSSSEIPDKSIVICRQNEPLFDVYFDLISQNRNVTFVGEDILYKIDNFMKPYSYSKLHQASHEMIRDLSVLSLKANEEGAADIDKIKYHVFQNNFEVYQKIVENIQSNLGITYVKELQNHLKNTFFKDKPNSIKLMTIHKSKGLENDIVVILNEFLMPSKLAKTEEELLQEKNLKFVARTRAKNELYFLNIK